MFNAPYTEFELMTDKMRKIKEFGKAKNTKKPIYWRITVNGDIKHINAYQLGGANINMTIIKSVNNLNALADFSHEGKFQKSVDLLATILEHKGTYQRI